VLAMMTVLLVAGVRFYHCLFDPKIEKNHRATP
jgi:hypothetical protein